MGLSCLLAKKRFDVYLLIFDLKTVYFVGIVDVLVNERVFKHLAGRKLYEQVSRHIVSEESHDDGTSSRFLNSATVYLQEVQVAIDVHLAVLVLQDACTWQYLAVFLCEMKESLKVVDVWTLHEVGWVKIDSEPGGHSELLVTENYVLGILVDRHVHAKGDWVEVEHDGLLLEAESTQGSCDHLVDVVVKGLLNIDCWGLYHHSMPSNLHKRHNSLLEFEVFPPLLDSEGSSPLNNHVDGVLL